MATDPALLFYTSDFLTGTYTMTNEHVGMYVRLLCLQHQKEKLSEKDMLNVCGTYVEDVFLKFKKKGQYFYNERLRAEAERRKKFCESRRLSRQGSKNKEVIKERTSNVRKSYVRRMETETETINDTVNRLKEGVKGETIKDENWDAIKLNFLNAYQWKEKFCRDKNIGMEHLEQQMNFFISDIELREEYKPLKELKSHFTNLYNKKNGNTHQRTSNAGNKLGTSAARIEALKKW